MKKSTRLKLFSTVAVIALASIVMTGCSATTSSSGVTAAKSVLQKVIDAKVLTVGMVLSIPPYESKDASGTPVGYDVDLAQALADSLGAKLQIVDMAADARIASVQTGKVDVLFTAITRTLERAQSIDFTIPYVASGPVLVALAGGSISSPQDMTGKKVGVLKGTTYDALADQALPGVEKVYFESNPDQTVALQNGQIDAYLQDGNSAAFDAGSNKKLKLVKGEIGFPEYDAFAIQKGDQVWLNYLNQFIFTVEADGSNKAAFLKWFGTERPFSPQLSSN
jgi:polar amino acid transport system substrate-binding protein